MPTLTANANQFSQAVEVSDRARLVATNGYVQYTTDSLVDVRNNVATWTNWPLGAVAGSADTVGAMVVRLVALGSGARLEITDPGGTGIAPENLLWATDDGKLYRASNELAGDIGNLSNIQVFGTPSPGLIPKWNGTQVIWDTDLTTAGTGVLISGTTEVPTAGTGSNGDYYVNTVTGMLWGPKAAGAWPATPFPPIPGSAQKARAIPSILFRSGQQAAAAINSALQTYGYVELEPSNTYGSNVSGGFPTPDANAGNFSVNYRANTPILIPRYGELSGRNSWINIANGPWTGGNFSPVVGFASTYPDLTLTSGAIGAAQDQTLAYLRGICVSGDLNIAPVGGERIIGISSGLLTNSNTPARTGGQPWASGLYLLTHARNVIENCSVQQCYYGFLLTMDQYSVRRNLKAGGGNKVGFVHYQSYLGGGMVDMPEISQLLAWPGDGDTIGHLFIFGRQLYPVHPYILRGSWAKATGCAYCFVWDPLETPTAQSQEIILDSGSTEFNRAGLDGYTGEVTVDCISRPDAAPLATFSYGAKKVELDIDQCLRVVCRDYTFQTDGLAWAYLRGPHSRVALQGDTVVPEQTRMAVRAMDAEAATLFEGCWAQTGGCWENVRNWDMEVRNDWDETRTQAAVYCGWADPELISGAPTELALATFTNRIAPNFSASENGVTVSTVTDNTGGDQTGNVVTQLAFPSSKAAGERAMTPFLGGGASAKVYSSGSWRWSFVRLKNMHSAPVRIVPYMRNAGGFLRGANPANLGQPIEAAVTLWPDQWMVVAIYWSVNSDGRFTIERADTTTTAFNILATQLSDVRMPLSKRFVLNRAMQRLVYV